MRRFWESQFPVGDPFRGAPYGERTDPVSIGTFATYASAAAAATSIGSAFGLFGGKDGGSIAPPPPPPAPLAPPTMASPQVNQAGIAARQRAAAAGGIMSNIATGPGGTTGPASITGKTLLGQ